MRRHRTGEKRGPPRPHRRTRGARERAPSSRERRAPRRASAPRRSRMGRVTTPFHPRYGGRRTDRGQPRPGYPGEVLETTTARGTTTRSTSSTIASPSLAATSRSGSCSRRQARAAGTKRARRRRDGRPGRADGGRTAVRTAPQRARPLPPSTLGRDLPRRRRVPRLLATEARVPQRVARPSREGGPARGRLGRRHADFSYFDANGDRALLEIAPVPSWRDFRFRCESSVGSRRQAEPERRMLFEGAERDSADRTHRDDHLLRASILAPRAERHEPVARLRPDRQQAVEGAVPAAPPTRRPDRPPAPSRTPRRVGGPCRRSPRATVQALPGSTGRGSKERPVYGGLPDVLASELRNDAAARGPLEKAELE